MFADNVVNMLNALTETSIYVIEEKTFSLLYFNRRCQATGRGRAEIGAKCYDVWPELCANCPLRALGNKGSKHIVCLCFWRRIMNLNSRLPRKCLSF